MYLHLSGVILPQLAAMSAYTLQMSNQTRRLDLAVALIEAFSSAVYCSLSKQTISTILLPGLRYLEPISGQSLSAHHDTVMAMIKGAESRVEPQQPIERTAACGGDWRLRTECGGVMMWLDVMGLEERLRTENDGSHLSGSVSLATATANVGQGMEDMKQKVTKYFQSKPNINRQTNLPHLPALFRKK
uniref:Uncharacterized protein n=1 Tax=Timema cristinae TaxID=61476 RepID=A0A7R9D1D9_TIMCR|nr:unnamed protein product [Timema cristinae]